MPIKILGHEYYSPKELAELLNVSIPTAHKLIRDKMPAVKIGAKILIPISEVLAYLNSLGIAELEEKLPITPI
jgi:excisionase family DNA binding protein